MKVRVYRADKGWQVEACKYDATWGVVCILDAFFAFGTKRDSKLFAEEMVNRMKSQGYKNVSLF